MPASGRKLIDAYGDGGFRISGQRLEGSCLVLPDEALPWPVTEFAALDHSALAPILERADRIDVLLLGCGAAMGFLKPELRQVLKDGGIAVDSLDSGAACRTYNVLVVENRNVAAALIAI